MEPTGNPGDQLNDTRCRLDHNAKPLRITKHPKYTVKTLGRKVGPAIAV